MHGNQPIGEFDKTQWLKNWPVAQEYIEFQATNHWIPAIEFQNMGGATTVMSDRNAAAVRVFPDGVANRVATTFRRPRMWLNGNVTCRLWYTGDLDSGHNSVIELGINLTQEDGTVATIADTAFEVPTPTADGDLMIYRSYERTADSDSRPLVTTENDLLSIIVRRSGATALDNYVENFELIGVELFYQQLQPNIGYKSNSIPRWLMKS